MDTVKIQQITAHLSRTFLGLVFVFSGFVKAIDPFGTVYKIEDYLKAFGGIFTDLLPLAECAAVALITIEFTLGVMLLFNVWSKVTTWVSLAFYATMLPLTLYIALFNPVSDCGCFGDALLISNWATFWKNVILTALVIVLIFTKNTVNTALNHKIQIAITTSTVFVVLCLMAYTYFHLPLLDFRPYKIGNNIPKLMEMPEDATPDIYDIKLIYAQNGVEQEFTLQNYPKGDSTWTFIDQKSILVQKGYEAPIHDFEILTADYEDITYDILESELPVTLVVMYDLDKSNRKLLHQVLALKKKCETDGTPFYILTGSGEETVQNFCQELIPYVCTCDPVTLKTIVRANPGVLVVQTGTIIDKYNVRNRKL